MMGYVTFLEFIEMLLGKRPFQINGIELAGLLILGLLGFLMMVSIYCDHIKPKTRGFNQRTN